MAKKWVAVEQHDDSECEPCAAIDGTTYTNRADAYADYPGGVGYKDCVGAQFGNACRGRVQKRRGASNEAASMTDISLLKEFRARLAERDALIPVQDKAPKPESRADWFSITNASADEVSINIFDEIGFYGTTAQGFVDQLNAITTPKITVYLNSPGGEVFDGIAIYSALVMSKAHVTTCVIGVAASAASFIAMAGDTIRMTRNATMMIHDASGLAWGNAETMRQEADLLDKLSDNIADMYAQQAGGTAADWRAAMKRETWYTGREALDAGLIDEVIEPDVPQEEIVPANRLSLALFNYAGRAEAPAPPIPPAEVEMILDTTERDAEEARLRNQDKADLLLAFLAERTKSL